MARIQLAQVLAGPVVGGVVVHIDFLPHPPGQEGHSVAVPRDGGGDCHFAVFIFPVFLRYFRIRSAVIHLPVNHGLRGVVHLELLVKEPIQGTDGNAFTGGGHRVGAEEGLLLAVGVGQGKFIVFPNDTNGGVNAVAGFYDFVGQLRAVAVPNHVRAPLLGQTQC